MSVHVEQNKLGFRQFVRDYGWCYVFITVPVLVFLLFTLFPVGYALVMSFQEYHVMGSTWIGLDNYRTMIADDVFWRSMRNTVIFTVGTVPVNVAITLFLAVLIFPRHKKKPNVFLKRHYIYRPSLQESRCHSSGSGFMIRRERDC